MTWIKLEGGDVWRLWGGEGIHKHISRRESEAEAVWQWATEDLVTSFPGKEAGWMSLHQRPACTSVDMKRC
jgi:hypothetical protein